MNNPYPARFDELLSGLPESAEVIDCASGSRRHSDKRVINLERDPSPYVDIVSDVLDISLESNRFDLVLSQAVLEHITQPQKAVDEMVRILKPGGTIYLEAAFIQPSHMLPWHYFNITPQGLDYLCRDLHKVGGGSLGSLAFTFEWMMKEAGVRENFDTLQFLDHIQDHEIDMTPQQVSSVASGVWFEGVKCG